NVDVILAPGPEATLRAASRATRTTPIVMVAIDYDPVELGYVASLARPGGNITGVFLQQLELSSKRLELVKEIFPNATEVTVLWDAFSADQFRALQGAAATVGLRLRPLEMIGPSYNYDQAMQGAARGG